MVIGLTGDFGSGKSTVAAMFKSCGAKIIDADKIGHLLLKPKTAVYKRLIRAFGRNILSADNSIDRVKLADIAFSRRESLRKLNNIMHPEIIHIIKAKLAKAGKKTTVIDAALLIESGLDNCVDRIVVVKLNRVVQMNRLLNKGFSERCKILARIKAQMPIGKKLLKADFIIDNNGTKKKTRIQVEKAWKEIVNRN